MLELVKLDFDNYDLLCEMMDEWTVSESNITPKAINKNDYHNRKKYIEEIEVTEAHSGLVPASTFFCFDAERNIFVGAVNIRHYLNERLLLNIGHIGVGIRPSERNKGYGTKMVALALEECKKIGLDNVLMVCDKNNTASARTIIKNGGIMENEVEVNGRLWQRYWIKFF